MAGGRSWLQPVLFGVALATALVLNLTRLGANSLRGDESIYAFPARAAAVHGAWYPLTLGDGEIFKSKPPLMVWPIAASFRLLGVSERAARLPSALEGVALVGLVDLFAAWLMGPWAGCLAALLLATCRPWLTSHGTRDGVGEALLCLAIMTALLCYLRFRAGPSGRSDLTDRSDPSDPSDRRRRWLLAAAAASAVTALVKGAWGPILLAAITLAWEALGGAGAPTVVSAGEPGRPPGWRPWVQRLAAPLVLAAAGLAAWGVYLLDLGRRGVDVRAFLGRDIVQRLTQGIDPAHVHGWAFYPHVLGQAFGHWWPALLPAAWALRRGWRRGAVGGERAAAWRMVALWALVTLALLQVSVSNLPWYVAPALPPLAILLAAGCREAAAFLGRWRWAPPVFGLLVATLLVLRTQLAWATLQQRRPLDAMHRLAIALRHLPEAQLYVGDLGASEHWRFRPWNRFYLSELEDRARPLPAAALPLAVAPPPGPSGCVFVVTAQPSAAAARLGRPAGPAVPLERRSPDDGVFYIVDFCGGRFAAAQS